MTDTTRQNLLDAMGTWELDPAYLRALEELLYTATETGILPFDSLQEDGNDQILTKLARLMELAKKYTSTGVPSDLRM